MGEVGYALSEIVVGEAAVGATRDAREGALTRILFDLLPCLRHGGDEVLELELVERLPRALEGFSEDVLRPLDVLFRGRRVPLRSALERSSDEHGLKRGTYAVEDVELDRAVVAVSASDLLTVGRRDGLK